MIIGDPYKFALIYDRVAAWNSLLTDDNGFFSFCINGSIIPDIAINAVLSVRVRDVIKSLANIPVNEVIFNMDKNIAIKALYQIVFPEFESDNENDYRYLLAPPELTDNDYFIFAVEGKDKTRILSARLKYDIENSTHIFENAVITEVTVDKNEINDILNHLEVDPAS